MKRKEFFQSLVPLAAAVPALGAARAFAASRRVPHREDPLPVTLPPYLVAGDTVGIACGSGPIDLKEIQPSIAVLESWGYKALVGHTIGQKDGMFGGTDAERTADIQAMLDNPDVKALLFARGGYGMVRIIDNLDFSRFSGSPKWLIGFSDVTVIHAHVHRHYRVATIHSKMCNSFPDVYEKAEPIIKDCIDSIGKTLKGASMTYVAPHSPMNREGAGDGQLIGGNLRTMENLAGTASDFSTEGKILFIEDVEEYYYNLDRMLWNFRRTGKLQQLKGLIVGGFNRMMDDPKEPFGKTHYDIITFHTKDFTYPVCFDFPVGHQKDNYALRCGQVHHLEVTQDGVRLTSVP
jgi:muramoyltetrapeptide carboxypeptidase